jgi:hypothetical protein
MQQPERVNYKMTDEQKAQFSEIIANYDSENMTKEDMESLRSELETAGIKPGDDLKELMEGAGFKPPQKPQGGMPPREAGTNSGIPDYMQDFAEKFKSGTATEDDLNNLMSLIESQNLSYSGNLVNTQK